MTEAVRAKASLLPLESSGSASHAATSSGIQELEVETLQLNERVMKSYWHCLCACSCVSDSRTVSGHPLQALKLDMLCLSWLHVQQLFLIQPTTSVLTDAVHNLCSFRTAEIGYMHRPGMKASTERCFVSVPFS